MTRKVTSFDPALPAGSQFPTPLKAEVLSLIAGQLGGPLANPQFAADGYIEPISRLICPVDVPMDTGLVTGQLFTMREDADVDAIATISVDSSTHAAASKCRVGIYRTATPAAAVAPLTCVARSASSASRWNGGALNVAPIVDDGADTPGTIDHVTLVAGERYAAVLMSVGHTGTPKVLALGGFHPSAFGPPIGWSWGGFTDLPASLSGGSQGQYNLPWLALRIAD